MDGGVSVSTLQHLPFQRRTGCPSRHRCPYTTEMHVSNGHPRPYPIKPNPPMTLTRMQRAYKRTLTQLTAHQREAIYGMLLGDAHIHIPPGCRDATVEFMHSHRQYALVAHLFELVRAWTWYDAPRMYVHTASTPRLGGRLRVAHHVYRFRTFTHPVLTPIHGAFYTHEGVPSTCKRVPDGIDTWLTPRVLAYHLMGDGSIGDRGVYLHTHGFCREDSERYVGALNEGFGLHGYLARDRRASGTVYWRLRFPASDLDALRVLVVPHLLPTFRYKVGF